MSQIQKSSTSNNASAVVLFGLSESGRPQAGLFPERQAGLAKKVAKQLQMTALTLSPTALAALGTKIPAGRLYANRKTLVPNVKRDVHEKLLELAKAESSNASGKGAGSPGPTPPPAGIPKDWDQIAVGHQVLASESTPEGWWEAIVLERTGDMLKLKWRDYPKEDTFTMHFRRVALQQAHAD
jgi:hypothetical protein